MGLHLHLDATGGRAAHDKQVLGGQDQLECVSPLRITLKQPLILATLSTWMRTSAESFEVELSPAVDSKSSSRRIDHSLGGNRMFSERDK